MHHSVFLLLLAAGAYFVGSIPIGFLIGKAHSIDIREHGSGNIGATNVFRVVGRGWGSTAFVLDFLKGLAPVVAARLLSPDAVVDVAMILAAIFAILGHNFTCWLGFRGGKGIATSAGALLALMPWIMLGVLIAWALVFAISRYVSLASIVAAGLLPVLTILREIFFPTGSWLLAGFAVLIGVLAIWRHRSNIQRLRAGTESRFSKKAKSTS